MDDDGEGDERRALERAERVEDVADRVVDERGAAGVATLFPQDVGLVAQAASLL